MKTLSASFLAKFSQPIELCPLKTDKPKEGNKSSRSDEISTELTFKFNVKAAP